MLTGRVGIFWLIEETECDDSFLLDQTALAEASVYGDCLTHDAGHFEVWERWRSGGLSGTISASARQQLLREYDEVPRGRVVYSVPTKLFWIYADRRIQTSHRLEVVSRAFGISAGAWTTRYDSHYL